MRQAVASHTSGVFSAGARGQFRQQLKFNFLRKYQTVLFLKFNMPTCSQRSIDTLPRPVLLSNAWGITKPAWRAVSQSRERDVLCRWPKPISERLKSIVLRKNETSMYPELVLCPYRWRPIANHRRQAPHYSAWRPKEPTCRAKSQSCG